MRDGNKNIITLDKVIYRDILKIIFGDKCIEKIIVEEVDDFLTFGDVLNIAKENGYKDGIITLIAESPLSGDVYQFGNYGDIWVNHGTVKGYA